MQVQQPKKGYTLIKSRFGKYEEVPEDWEPARQGDVCEFINGYAYSQSEFRESGYPIIRIQNLNGGQNFVYSDVELPKKQFAEKGDLLYAWSATFGPFIWDGPKAAFHYHQWKVIPNDSIDKTFLYYHLERITPTIKNMGQSGLGMFHMTKESMEKFLFFKPKLKREQQKIASILSNVDSEIQQTQKIIEQSQNIKKGLMQKLLIKGLKHTKFRKIKSFYGKYEEVPEDWSRKQLSELGDLSAGGTPSTFNEEYWKDGTIPWISSGEVKNNRIYDSEKKITNSGLKNSAAKRFPKGTVLVAITGFGTTRGKSSILEIEASTNQSVVGIIPKPKVIFSDFLWFALQNQYWTLRNFAQGTQQPGLNLDILEKFQIFLPNNITEQQKIASILSNVDSEIQIEQDHKSKLETLKNGLMQKLLTGQIRVKV